MERSIRPSAHAMNEYLNQAPAGHPIVMLNLLKYREKAQYTDEAGDVPPSSGREAYQRYEAGVKPLLRQVEARLLWMGKVQTALIAPAGESWDDAFLIQYPSKDAFLRMIALPEYRKQVLHRMAALEDSRLIATLSDKPSFQ